MIIDRSKNKRDFFSRITKSSANCETRFQISSPILLSEFLNGSLELMDDVMSLNSDLSEQFGFQQETPIFRRRTSIAEYLLRRGRSLLWGQEHLNYREPLPLKPRGLKLSNLRSRSVSHFVHPCFFRRETLGAKSEVSSPRLARSDHLLFLAEKVSHPRVCLPEAFFHPMLAQCNK